MRSPAPEAGGRCRGLVCLGCGRLFPDWDALDAHLPGCDRVVQGLLRALPPGAAAVALAWLARTGPVVVPPSPDRGRTTPHRPR